MGIEDFSIRLSAGERPVIDVVERIKLTLGVGGHEYARDGSLLVNYEDESHIVEMAVSDGEQTRIYMRVALCQPSTVDATFSALVCRVAGLFDASVLIQEDEEADDPSLGWEFAANDSGRLREAIEQRIPKKRLLWQTAFGARTAKLTCQQAIDAYIVEREQS